jgi:hypothetical protein
VLGELLVDVEPGPFLWAVSRCCDHLERRSCSSPAWQRLRVCFWTQNMGLGTETLSLSSFLCCCRLWG